MDTSVELTLGAFSLGVLLFEDPFELPSVVTGAGLLELPSVATGAGVLELPVVVCVCCDVSVEEPELFPVDGIEGDETGGFVEAGVVCVSELGAAGAVSSSESAETGVVEIDTG